MQSYFLYLEDGGSRYLQNIGTYVLMYSKPLVIQYPISQNSHAAGSNFKHNLPSLSSYFKNKVW
jgi:hypothetical protein